MKNKMECVVCKKPAQVNSLGELERTCDHKDSPVVAKMSATLSGKGGLTPRY